MHLSRLTFFFLLLTIPATCFSWPGKVVSVADSDTIIVQHNGQQVKVKLDGIDCPETGKKAFGQKAH
jgi:endonuclease YncB( thermonuclease family)